MTGGRQIDGIWEDSDHLEVAETRWKSLSAPDEVIRFPGMVNLLVEVGDLTVARSISDPGWRWSKDVRPLVGGEWCQARHVGIVVSGGLGVLFSDGSTLEFRPDDVYDISPGHDGYTIGDEPCVLIEWSGIRAFAGFRSGPQSRVLATLLFTDLADSTSIVAGLGDGAWREMLSAHYETARSNLEHYGGREVKTTGDGLFATFLSPVHAIRCAAAIREAAATEGLQVRAGVHVGEVELVGSDVRGISVHVAARIMSQAAPAEILVSETTRTLALASGLRFEERGTQSLKGLSGDWRLFTYLADINTRPVHPAG